MGYSETTTVTRGNVPTRITIAVATRVKTVRTIRIRVMPVLLSFLAETEHRLHSNFLSQPFWGVLRKLLWGRGLWYFLARKNVQLGSMKYAVLPARRIEFIEWE